MPASVNDMIRFEKITLGNGLRVLVHHDPASPLAAVNVLYDVGSRDEDPGRTGFAHLFEHLMFGGSVNIPSYDTPLQKVGGENNAFTNTDITNYYLTLPSNNLDTGLWLESDRMLELNFTEKNLQVQRHVVIEEFKQRYLNQPYGDAILLLRPLAYKVHPYRWPTIGREISHIQEAGLEEVKEFFYSHYAPNNAILVLAGNVPPDRGFERAAHWFGDIERRNIRSRSLPAEPPQESHRQLTVHRPTPFDALYLAFHMPERLHKDYHACDLISDILSNGKSSRLYRSLVMEQKLFSDINAYITGERDPGLFMITGKLTEGVPVEKGEKAIHDELKKIREETIPAHELAKVKNQVEANWLYGETDILNRAMNLALFEWLGDAEMINSETEKYREVTAEQIKRIARDLFRMENLSTLYYLRQKEPLNHETST